MNWTIWQYAYWSHFPFNLTVESDSWFTQGSHLVKVNQAGGPGRSNTRYWYILESAIAPLLAAPRLHRAPWTLRVGLCKTHLPLPERRTNNNMAAYLPCFTLCSAWSWRSKVKAFIILFPIQNEHNLRRFSVTTKTRRLGDFDGRYLLFIIRGYLT